MNTETLVDETGEFVTINGACLYCGVKIAIRVADPNLKSSIDLMFCEKHKDTCPGCFKRPCECL